MPNLIRNFIPSNDYLCKEIGLKKCIMATAIIKYLGDLRTECTHISSGEVIYTDAPIDNKGKGEKFSPTDLLATSYASCMLTIVGIYCQEHEIPFKHGIANVKKHMVQSPRRVSALDIELDLRNNNWNKEVSEKVIRAAKACPVAKSIHPELKINFTFQV
jgi:putative redox protein